MKESTSIDAFGFRESVIIKYLWCYRRRCEFPTFGIEFMSFVEELCDLRDVCSTRPSSTDRRIDDTMPDISGFGTCFGIIIDIASTLGIVDKYLIREVDIGVETWELRSIFFYIRNGDIPDKNGSYKCRCSLLPISFIIEFFIFGGDNCNWSIRLNHEDTRAYPTQISSNISRIA